MNQQLRRVLSKKDQLSKVLHRSFGGSKLTNPEYYEELISTLKRKKLLLRAAMTKKRKIVLQPPAFIGSDPIRLPLFNLSELAGHGSFVFLALSYLESDFLNLRLYAFSGITLSILFQYYREIPLWIPIRWNALFLLINTVMIGLLIKKQSDAANMTEDQKKLYEQCFRNKGMSQVDFFHLISMAKRMEAKKGTRLVSMDKKNTRLYLVQKGKLSVYKHDQKIGVINQSQFVGEMSYLRWQTKKHEKESMRLAEAEAAAAHKKVTDGLDAASNLSSLSWKTAETAISNILGGHPKDVFVGDVFMGSTNDGTTTTTTTVDGSSDAANSTSAVAATAVTAADGSAAPSSSSSSSGGILSFLFSPSADQTTATTTTTTSTTEVASSATTEATTSSTADVAVTAPATTAAPTVETTATVATNPATPTGTDDGTTTGPTNPANNSNGNAPTDIVVIVADEDEGHLGQADVICDEDCVVYYWKFKDLYELIAHNPLLGLVIERSFSEDLNTKMSNSWQGELMHRYKMLLGQAVERFHLDKVHNHVLALRELGGATGVDGGNSGRGSEAALTDDEIVLAAAAAAATDAGAAGGVTTSAMTNRNTLQAHADPKDIRDLLKFRAINNISDLEHERVFQEVLVEQEKRDRERAAEKVQENAVTKQYRTLLRNELQRPRGVSEAARKHLREYRLTHQITAQTHVALLQDFGWTLDEYEMGRRLTAKDVKYYRARSALTTSSSSTANGATAGTAAAAAAAAPPTGSPTSPSAKKSSIETLLTARYGKNATVYFTDEDDDHSSSYDFARKTAHGNDRGNGNGNGNGNDKAAVASLADDEDAIRDLQRSAAPHRNGSGSGSGGMSIGQALSDKTLQQRAHRIQQALNQASLSDTQHLGGEHPIEELHLHMVVDDDATHIPVIYTTIHPIKHHQRSSTSSAMMRDGSRRRRRQRRSSGDGDSDSDDNGSDAEAMDEDGEEEDDAAMEDGDDVDSDIDGGGGGGGESTGEEPKKRVVSTYLGGMRGSLVNLLFRWPFRSTDAATATSTSAATKTRDGGRRSRSNDANSGGEAVTATPTAVADDVTGPRDASGASSAASAASTSGPASTATAAGAAWVPGYYLHAALSNASSLLFGPSASPSDVASPPVTAPTTGDAAALVNPVATPAMHEVAAPSAPTASAVAAPAATAAAAATTATAVTTAVVEQPRAPVAAASVTALVTDTASSPTAAPTTTTTAAATAAVATDAQRPSSPTAAA